MTRQMGELLSWRKSNKLFWEGERQQENYYFGGTARENVMEQESGKVGDAKFEPFQCKPEVLRLNSVCHEKKTKAWKKLTEKQSISKAD